MAEVVQPDGTVCRYPELNYRKEVVSASLIKKQIGADIPADRMAEMLTRMCLESTLSPDGDAITVEIPPTRSDILHPCDIMEDVAIAYGFDNIEKTVPKTNCIASQYPLNKLCDQLRRDVAACGFTEVLTFALCSRADVAERLNKDIKDVPAVHIANPKTAEFQIART